MQFVSVAVAEGDIVIIGGGVVGCSVLFGLTNAGYKCILLEKEPNLVSQASSGNSGMLHTGFDTLLGSLEQQCIKNCQKEIFGTLDSLGLPYSRLGATMVAWNSHQKTSFPVIVQKSIDAGADVFELSLSDLYKKEPYLSAGATGALWIPGETNVDPWLTPTMFAHHSKLRGGKVYTHTLVQSCSQDHKGTWNVTTDRGIVHCKMVINCAGLYGDIVDRLAGLQRFRIKPMKGQYLIYSNKCASLINSNILPVPTHKTKGVIVFKSVYNNVIVGPTAEDVEQRDTSIDIDPHITDRLRTHSLNTVRALGDHQVVQMYTGNRPATETKDYQIISHTEKNWLTVGGIRSTGLSSCLGVSGLVNTLVKERFNLEPSSCPFQTYSRVDIRFTDRCTAFLDDEEYTITHPLTAVGSFSTRHQGKL